MPRTFNAARPHQTPGVDHDAESYRAQIVTWARAYHRRAVVVPLLDDVSDGDPALAHVSGGDWIVQCECGEGAVVQPGWPMYCANCLNARHGGKWRVVAWPHNAVEIDAELEERPARHQNWHPAIDTVDALRAENHAKPWETVAAGDQITRQAARDVARLEGELEAVKAKIDQVVAELVTTRAERDVAHEQVRDAVDRLARAERRPGRAGG